MVLQERKRASLISVRNKSKQWNRNLEKRDWFPLLISQIQEVTRITPHAICSASRRDHCTACDRHQMAQFIPSLPASSIMICLSKDTQPGIFLRVSPFISPFTRYNNKRIIKGHINAHTSYFPFHIKEAHDLQFPCVLFSPQVPLITSIWTKNKKYSKPSVLHWSSLTQIFLRL